MNSGIVPAGKSSMAAETSSPNGFHSSNKNEGKVPRRIHKAEREKMKRGHLNDLFLALANSLELPDQNNGKAFLLNEATRIVTDTIAQIKCLKRDNAALLSESQYMAMEKKELQDENFTLEAEIGNLKAKLKARVSESELDLNMAPPECFLWEMESHASRDHLRLPSMQSELEQGQTLNSFYATPFCSNVQAYVEPGNAELASKPMLVRKPHPRYPTPADTWPSQLLEKQPELGKEILHGDRNNSKGC